MNTYIKSITIGALALTLVASPLVSFAKENTTREQSERSISRMTDKENKGKGSEQKIERTVNKNIQATSSRSDDDDERDNKGRGKSSSNSSCLKAYGHLIAPGWIKKNGSLDIDASNCWLPFGINKKFRGNNSSSTPDVTAPVISNVAITAAQRQAEVRWSTNENANSIIFWNTTSSVDTSDTATNRIAKNDFVKNHRVILKNLMPSTTYYVVVKSKDASGNASQSDVTSFTTQAPSADTRAPTISNVVNITSTSTIQVGWKTNENTTDRVYYSTVLPVILNASTTSFVSNSSPTVNHVVTLSGLTPNTTYYIVIESTDTAGNVSTSATFSTHTNTVVIPADTTAPVISALSATAGSSTTTIAWTTNEGATSKVFYSTISPLDIATSTTASVLNSALVTSHSIAVSGLATSTVYYFKVQSVDGAGNTSTSDQFSATTTSGM